MKINRNYLYNLYIKQKLSLSKIARLLNCSDVNVYYYMKKFDIELRHLKGNHPWNFKGGKNRFSNCKDCGKKLSSLKAIRCKKCDIKFRKGINGRNYKGIKHLCIDCKIQLKNIYSKRCHKCNTIFWRLNPSKHPAYIHGKCREPYAFGFTRKLKESIRKRDNHICQLCNKKIIHNTKEYFLAIHHIDYNKKNCKETNLISLCGGCNSKVNYDRNKWMKYFKILIKKILIREE
jgi:hypothetical protein